MQWTRRAPAPSNHPLLNDELRDGKEMKVQRQFRTESSRLVFFFFWGVCVVLVVVAPDAKCKSDGVQHLPSSNAIYRRLLQPVKILEIFFVIVSYIFSYFML